MLQNLHNHLTRSELCSASPKICDLVDWFLLKNKFSVPRITFPVQRGYRLREMACYEFYATIHWSGFKEKHRGKLCWHIQSNKPTYMYSNTGKQFVSHWR